MNQTKSKISVMMFLYDLASVIALVPGHFLIQSNFEVKLFSSFAPYKVKFTEKNQLSDGNIRLLLLVPYQIKRIWRFPIHYSFYK